MDSVIERYLKRWEINGAQLVITRNDSLLYARGFGMADKERGIRMEPNMLMRFASVSKLITAVGIMKLQEMKKLKLNEKVFGEKESCAIPFTTTVSRTSDITTSP